MTPSEILGALRNDGRSRHHLGIAQAELDRLEEKLAEIKEDLAAAADRPADPIGGS